MNTLNELSRKVVKQWLLKEGGDYGNKEKRNHATVHAETEYRTSLPYQKFRLLQRMAHSSKALRNVGLYTIKQSYLNDNNGYCKEVDNAMRLILLGRSIKLCSSDSEPCYRNEELLKRWNSGRNILISSQVVRSFRIILVPLTNESLKSIKSQKWMRTDIGWFR